METTWSMLRNTFDNVTKFNYKRMLLMASDHHDKLATLSTTDTNVNALYQRFLPAFTSFKGAYQKVSANYAMYQGYTQAFEERIAALTSTLARKWDVSIQVEYDERSFEYKMLLPNGRAPFQSSAYDMRLSAISSLVINLREQGNPALQPLANTIETWLNETQTTRTQQQGIEQKDAILRNNLEEARAQLAVEMHGVFFGLSALYYQNLTKVETFYELKYLRTTGGKDDTAEAAISLIEKPIEPDTEITVIQGDWTPLTELKVTNTGNTVCYIWTTSQVNGTAPADATPISPQQTVIFTVDELSDGSLSPTLLRARNGSQTTTAKISAGVLGS